MKLLSGALLSVTLFGMGVMSRSLMAVEAVRGAYASEASDSVVVSSWKTYRNEKQGFEVKYPDTWTVNEGSGTTEIIIIRKPRRVHEADASVTLAIQRNQNPKNLRIDDWFAEQLKLMHASPESTGRITIGAKAAVFMENTNNFGKQRDVFTSLHQTDVLSLSYKPQAEFDAIYAAITSSFRVID